jgi:hypothetical protein
MRSDASTYLWTLALVLAVGCAGSGRSRDTGPAPFDTVHIRSGDTLPPANPPDTARPANPSARGADTAADSTDTTRVDTTRAR